MTMIAKIANAIASQNFELIRDQVGAVLLVEFTNQGANYGLRPDCVPKDVLVEGFMQIDESLLPTISVRCVSATELQKDSSGDAVWEYCFYLDIYTGSGSTLSDRGDQLAIYALQKMIGIARAILEDPRYDMLGFADGVMNIWNTHVEDWYINLPKNNDDLVDGTCGRMEFHVTAAETPSSYTGTVPVQWVDTNVQLVDSVRGYHWVMKEQAISVGATGATLTNTFFSNEIRTIQLLDTMGNIVATYAGFTDFTQTGTTITAVTFTFTSGTIINAIT